MKSAPWKGRDGSGKAGTEKMSTSLSPCFILPPSLLNVFPFPRPHPLLGPLAAPEQTPNRRTGWIQLDRLLHHKLESRDVLPHQIDRDLVLSLFYSSSQRKSIKFVPRNLSCFNWKSQFPQMTDFSFLLQKHCFFLAKLFVLFL